ncbi:SIMPL domain-containing protein [Sulfitobacter sp. JB4-11]|uniref:SIMPL domain-containing protein n=1 Tax=Sulfitobacter rhodophyticola TaxID=3238304 RepID=UPI003516C810
MKTRYWMAALWLALAPAAHAEDVAQGVFVQGEGRISVAPDMAKINLGVRERAKTAQDAMDAMGQSITGVLDALKMQGIAAEDQQTSRFYLNPIYNEARLEDGRQITGYEAGNGITVTVRDLDTLGTVLDAVIATGANDFNGLSFGLQDDSAAMEQARKAAVADAMMRARVLAEAGGLNLGPVLQLSDGAAGAGPMHMGMADARASMESAIAPGEVDITARVTMVFAISAVD